jgi:hypothetical protein
MPYNTKEKRIRNYYKTRKRRLEYQRKYDRAHKKQKTLNDKKRRKKINYHKIIRTQHYSQRVHSPELMKKYGKCQICGSKEKLQIHHKKYDTKNIRDCKLVCLMCHKKLHRKYKLS